MWFQKGWYFKKYVFWISISKDFWYIDLPHENRHYMYLSVSKTKYDQFKVYSLHIFQVKIAFMKLK